MKQLRKAFTLVELIVVITILAVLGTVAFIAFQSYTVYARDVVRTADLGSISRAISIKISQGGYAPKPESFVEITSSGTTVMYQGEFTQEMGKRYGVNGDLVDPLDGKNYTYSTDVNLYKHELAAFLEGGETSVFSGPEAYAGPGRIVKTKGDKLGIILTPEEIPVQETLGSGATLDIVQTTDTYKVYFDDNDTLEGTGSVLFSVNPRSSCTRLFDLANTGIGSGEYNIINPYGEELTAFCDIRFKDNTFYAQVDDGDMESIYSQNWSEYDKTTDDSISGMRSLKFIGNKNAVRSSNFSYVQPGKGYALEGWFKSSGSNQSRIYFGFAEYDKDFKFIANSHVNAKPGTETTLSSDVVGSDNQIQFHCDDTLYSRWRGYMIRHSRVAFDVDDSGKYEDLPNRNLSKAVSNSNYRTGIPDLLTRSGNICTFTYHATVGNTVGRVYPTGTKIRMHISGGTYNYRAASNQQVPFNWTKFSGIVQGESSVGTNKSYFRKGTRFIKIMMHANYRQTTDEILLVDDIKLVEQ